MAETIGRTLKALRNRAGLSSRAVAERLGMPASTYQKYEDRYRRPYLPLHLVAKLVQALRPEGIPADEIWQLAEPNQVETFFEAWQARSEGSGAPLPDANWQAREHGRRRFDRWSPMPAQLSHDGETQTCVVRDISPAGACVLADAAHKLREAAEVLLELSNYGQVPAQVTRAEGQEIGLMFANDSDGERQMAEWLSPIRRALH